MIEKHPTTILAIDDDAIIRQGLRDYLEDKGFRVLTAENGINGMDLFRREKPDLVLVDLRMPEMDGLEVLAQIRQIAPDIPVIIVSGAGIMTDVVEALHLGAWAYILKPIDDMSVLDHAVKNVLERARLIQENRQYQEHLENLVKQRTDELQSKNEDLVNINIRLRRIVETTSGLTMCSQVLQLGTRLLEEFAANMNATGGSFYMIEDNGLNLLHTLDPGHAVEFIPFPLPQGSVLEHALNRKAPLLVYDINDASYLMPSGWDKYPDASLLIFPLRDENGRMNAVISLHNKTLPPFTEQDKDLGAILASFSCEALHAVRATDALRENERKYRLLTENQKDVVASISLDGRLLYCSPSVTEFGGYKAEEEIGQPIAKYFATDKDLSQVIELIEKVVLDEGTPTINFLYQPKDREPFPVEASSKPLIEDGEVVAIQVVLRDITERRQAERKVSRLAMAIEQADELMIITDTKGTIEYVNPAFERLTRYSSDEAIGKNTKILKSGKQSKTFYADMWNTILKGGVWKGHLINRKKDGSLYEEDATISPLKDESGEIVNFVAVKRDVTRENQLERQISQSQKMEAIGSLAGGIAHDFNNILSVIIGYTEIACIDVPEGSKADESLNKVMAACDRAKNLTKQILSFSRHKEEEVKPISIVPIVKEVVKLLRATLPSTIEIRQNLEIEIGVVEADPTKIHQILMNLCTNAHHAMRNNGGILEISLAPMDVTENEMSIPDYLKPGSYLKLSISDTGIGMDRDTIDRIFEPYFTTKKIGEGTGLGLSVVHGIAESYKGTVMVESESGKGSTFHVYLPRVKFADAELVRGKPGPLPTGKERILFVDDEQDLVAIGKQILEHLGYHVVTRTSSVEALELFQNKPDKFDLVITDMTMPNMTGLELSEELLRVRPDIPIILCTGFSENVSAESAKRAGIRKFVMKPLVMGDFANTVRKALGHQTD